MRRNNKTAKGRAGRGFRSDEGKGKKKKSKNSSKNSSKNNSANNFRRNKLGNFSSSLPESCVVIASSVNEDGELIAVPALWNSRTKPPYIVVTESGRGKAAVIGDKLLAKMRRIAPHIYQALVIRVLPEEESRNIIGMLVMTVNGGIIEPISRKMKESFIVAAADLGGAVEGELVAAKTLPGTPSMSMSYARITERLGSLGSPKAASLIATHMHELPTTFSSEALAEAETAENPLPDTERVDLRDIPLLTIDGADARDFDDAIFAESSKNGFHLIVAIADVAYYVREDSALDHDAYQRGNSVYFPDRVIPMLPERLSNSLCSLMPHEDRYCLAVHIWIDKRGVVENYQFVRGIMRSQARLTYEEAEVLRPQSPDSKQQFSSKKSKNNQQKNVQKNSKNDEQENEQINKQIKPQILADLWSAYQALAVERDKRGALDLNLPEYKINFDSSGNVAHISPKARLESHRLIETFMIAANVCAADFLIKNRARGIFRAHEAPDADKLEELRNLLKMSGYNLAKGNISAGNFNIILHKSQKEANGFMIHNAVLRAQMQAYYSAENLGHFGLSLGKYCHFTSPIRRYSDLVVHRAIVALIDSQSSRHKANDNKNIVNKKEAANKSLVSVALHVSETERKAMMAERDAADRYKVSYMARHIGSVFSGIISGLNEHGIFVTIVDNGITGFIPLRHIGEDFFIYEKKNACFRGRRSNKKFTIGDAMLIKIAEANAITGSLLFRRFADAVI